MGIGSKCPAFHTRWSEPDDVIEEGTEHLRGNFIEVENAVVSLVLDERREPYYGRFIELFQI